MAIAGYVSRSIREDAYIAARDLAAKLSKGRVKSLTVSEVIKLSVEAYDQNLSESSGETPADWFTSPTSEMTVTTP
jgi:hypothetical protein